MARTMAAERLGIAPEVIEAQLAHAKSGPLGAAYDRAQYLDQRRDLMQRWAAGPTTWTACGLAPTSFRSGSQRVSSPSRPL